MFETRNSKLTLRLCSLGERREQQPNLCLAFLTGVFLGHVFFDTSPSNLCVSVHKTGYCADQTWHVLWVWLHWAWGEAQITSSLQVVDLLCFLIKAQLLQTLFPCPGKTSQAALYFKQHIPFCSQSSCKDALASAKILEVEGVGKRFFNVETK